MCTARAHQTGDIATHADRPLTTARCRTTAASTTAHHAAPRLRLAERRAAGGLPGLQPRALRLRRRPGRQHRAGVAAARRAELLLARIRQPGRRVALPRAVRQPGPAGRHAAQHRAVRPLPRAGRGLRGARRRTRSATATATARAPGRAGRGRRGARCCADCRERIAGRKRRGAGRLALALDLREPPHARPAGRGRLPLHASTGATTTSRVRMRTRGGGTLWSVPYPQELNDIPMIIARQMDAKDFAADDDRQLRRDAASSRAASRW